MPTCSMKTRRAPLRLFRYAVVYTHRATGIHEIDTPPLNRECRRRSSSALPSFECICPPLAGDVAVASIVFPFSEYIFSFPPIFGL